MGALLLSAVDEAAVLLPEVCVGAEDCACAPGVRFETVVRFKIVIVEVIGDSPLIGIVTLLRKLLVHIIGNIDRVR